MAKTEELLDKALSGDRAALARLLSLAERGGEPLLSIEKRISSLIGNAHVLGITGPPGAGKSTLINGLLPYAVEDMGQVAVLAVDPSSPFSQGALLGDRVRMHSRNTGSDVFFRSMASRGEFGGLARAASTCARLFDACGWPLVIIETLGIGQVELDIMELADTVLVVLNPGWGDEIQANKAGLTEAGDIFAINKADKPGADQTRKDLLDSLALLHRGSSPPVQATTATTGEGLESLWHHIVAHRDTGYTEEERAALREQRQRRLISNILRRQIEHRIDTLMDSTTAEELIAGASLGDMDLDTTLGKLMDALAR